jgi:hypothetical protein
MPFEKIRSLVEKRKYFEDLIARKDAVVCKDERDQLFSFFPRQMVSESSVRGGCVAIDSMPVKNSVVIANFSVGEERFFFQGPMTLLMGSDEVTISIDSDLYKLQRRTHIRIQVEPELRLHMVITKYHNRSVYIETQVSDISAGGVRIHFSQFPIHSHPGIATANNPGLRQGDRFHAMIHPPSGKTLEVVCEVKHQLQSAVKGDAIDQYGCEFVDLSTLIKNRLLALSMDLQRKLVSGK